MYGGVIQNIEDGNETQFVVEDNNLSTNTPTIAAWNKKSKPNKKIHYYKYKRKFPHHGTGSWVLF